MFCINPTQIVIDWAVFQNAPFVVSTNKAAQDAGIAAGDLVAAFGPSIGGRGGGKPELAQGSGSDIAGIDAGIAAARARLAELTTH